ncbi:MAG: hypothetical protein NTX79_04645, partial [Candidatus Micrarchaeota archaeon]|nr:hypothetical protein [Candidatus Micrarchaeota archaeon]
FVGQVWSRKFDQGMANAPNNRAGENLVCRRSRLLLTCYPTLRKDRSAMPKKRKPLKKRIFSERARNERDVEGGVSSIFLNYCN